MPPRDEEEFWTTLGLPAGKAVVVRGVTTRPNITYSVRAVSSPDEETDWAVRLAEEAAGSYETTTGRRTKAILYCRAVARAEEIAELLGCRAYHARAGESGEKTEIVRRWVEEGGAIVATCALGAGIDIPDVRLVVHVGRPKTLRDFVQESGRAGRDGQPSRSVIISVGSRTTQCNNQRPQPQLQPHAPRGDEDVAELVRDSVGCRRTILSRVMDGRTNRIECEAGEAPCDLCEARLLAQAAPAVQANTEQERVLRDANYIVYAQVSQVRETQRQVEEFVRCLDFFRNNCVACLLFDSPEYQAHRFGNGQCSLPVHDDEDAWGDILGGVRKVQKIIQRPGGLKAYHG
ncbi:hypothetical protein OQA88_2934, partial [Cercophora sp. LCS_1]